MPVSTSITYNLVDDGGGEGILFYCFKSVPICILLKERLLGKCAMLLKLNVQHITVHGIFCLGMSLLTYLPSCSIVIFLYFPASGILKGYDPLLNLVLDDTTEHLRGELIFYVVS